MSASEGLKTPARPIILENIVAKALEPAPVPRAISVTVSPSRTADNLPSNSLSSKGESESASSSVHKPLMARAILPRAAKSPDAFRTISEVAEDLKVPQHVLRFWETKFSSIRPLKRGGGRRYYRPEDVNLLKRIHELLYTQGYTIKGAQKLLKGAVRARTVGSALADTYGLEEEASQTPDVSASGGAHVAPVFLESIKDPVQSFEIKEKTEESREGLVPQVSVAGRLSPSQREGLQAILTELTTLRTLLASARG